MSTVDGRSQGFGLRTAGLTWQHWTALVLSAITGVIHLWLAAQYAGEALGWAFLIAGVGFLAGDIAVLLDYRRRLVYLVGIPFTLGQIIAWYALNAPDFSPLGYADKAIQFVLIILLVQLYRIAR